MQLPEDDEAYLNGKGYRWELIPAGEEAFLVLHSFPVSAELYDHSAVDLMIRIPAQYPNAKLDMFYVDPALRLKSGGYPDRADHFEDHAHRHWQRFSRHIPDAQWRVGIDGIPTLLTFACRELQARSI